MSLNSLVEQQILVFGIQNALEVQLSQVELLEPSFGSDSPTFLSRNKLSILIDPNVGLVAILNSELAQSHIRATKSTFGMVYPKFWF